jgi:hypothetical protein
METRYFKTTAIRVGQGRWRALQAPVVQQLSDSIRKIGLRFPITVRIVAGAPMLITGLHRLKAAQLLGWTEIEAAVFDDEKAAKLWEIDENLQRAELTAIERSQHIAERARLLEQDAMTKQNSAPAPMTSREAARVAGDKQYQPDKPCIHGHTGLRFVVNNECVECSSTRKRGEGDRKVRQHAASSGVGGQHRGGNREAARSLGVSEKQVRRAKQIDGLCEKARIEAERLGLANNNRVLLYAASHSNPELQVKAVRSQAEKIEERKERKKVEKETVAAQAAGPVPAPFAMETVDHRRVQAREFWFWLIEECGDKAISIMARLRELDLPILLAEVDRIRKSGDQPAPARVH